MLIVAVFLVIVGLAASGMLDFLLGRDGKPKVDGEWGRFSGSPKTEWLDDGRNMIVLEDFTYTDTAKKVWLAKAGSKVNGASIPSPLWSIMGGPFEGKYRNASIVHDVACVERKEPSEAVHEMFYRACRCGGIEEIQAKILYSAVQLGGPSWVLKQVHESHARKDAQGNVVTESVTRIIAVESAPVVNLDEAKMKQLAEMIKERNPSLDQIKAIKLQ